MISFLRALFSVLAVGGVAIPSYAVPITYTEQVTATGRLGNLSFEDADVVITLIGDTANVVPGNISGVFDNRIGSPTVSVSGIGTATFITDVFQFFSNQNISVGGFSDFTTNRLVLDTSNAAFASYGLETAIGPLPGASDINSGEAFPTDLGAFVLVSVGDSTFTAVTGAVPEPASLALLGAAFAGIGWARRRRLH